MTLSDLKTGDRGVITSIDPKDKNISKLSGRGIVPGVAFSVLQIGNPLLIAIDDERWALSSEESSYIHVRITRPAQLFLRKIFRRK